MAFKNWCNKLIHIITSGNFCFVLYRPYDLKKENEPNLFKKWKTKLIGNNFSKYSLIFAILTILAGNKYIFTYLIRISIKIAPNKYTYWKKVLRRNPAMVVKGRMSFTMDSLWMKVRLVTGVSLSSSGFHLQWMKVATFIGIILIKPGPDLSEMKCNN